MKTWKISVLILMIAGLVILAGCESKATLTLSLTDAPSVDADEINITFGEIAVSTEMSTAADGSVDLPEEGEEEGEEEDASEWLVINADGGTFDLLELTNGQLEELGVAELAPGQYNQIRIYVESAEIVQGETTTPITVNSGAIKLVKGFDLVAGIDTNIILDFDAGHSLKEQGNGSYRLLPVIHMTVESETGAVDGTLTGTYDVPVMVSAWSEYDATDADAVPVAATLIAADGTFLLGYVEEGTYDITLEAEGFDVLLLEDTVVALGEVTTVTGAEGADLVLTPTVIE